MQKRSPELTELLCGFLEVDKRKSKLQPHPLVGFSYYACPIKRADSFSDSNPVVANGSN